MRGLLRHLWVWVVLAAVAGCENASSLPSVSSRQFVHPDVLAKADLEYYWTCNVVLGNNECIRQLYLLDENLYCLTDQRRLICLDASVGIQKWSYQVTTQNEPVYRPIHVNAMKLTPKPSTIAEMTAKIKPLDPIPFDAVLFNTLSHLFVLDRATGKEYRKVELSFPANTGGDGEGGLYYVPSTRGFLHCVRLQEALEIWMISIADMAIAPLEVYSGRAIVACADGTVQSVRTGGDPKILWTRKLYGGATAPIQAGAKGIFVPCEDKRLYGIRLDGTKMWDPLVAKGPLQDAVQVGANSVFQVDRNGNFYAVDLVNGTLRWTIKGGRLVVGNVGGSINLLDNAGNLLMVDEMLGTVKSSLPLPGMNLFADNTGTGAIFAGNTDGRLVCIRPLSAGHLTLDTYKVKKSEAPKVEAKGKKSTKDK